MKKKQYLSPVMTSIHETAEALHAAGLMNSLNVTTGIVSQWERGEKHPQGTSLKLLALVARNGLEAVA